MKFQISNITLFALLLLLAPSMQAQNERGLKTGKGIKMGKSGQTRAVIIGISEYEDDGIPDLQYADRDAEAFADYLQSPSGGSLSDDHIKTYYNEDATGGNIHKALYWLITESEENDNCIIYFSGHGDVETIYEDEPGHLLIHDSPASIYQINSLRVEDLNRIVKTLSVKNKAKVKLFTDACRAGKLAGSEVNGSQATAAAMNKQFGNEVKILSCQANEYSLEGPQWGGGRGVFSYHLIEGMTGLADTDNDYIVSLKELQRYLEDEVHNSLDKPTQTPVTIGDRNSKISYVNNEALEFMKQDKNLDGAVAMLDTDESNLHKGNPKDQLIENFYKALKADYLIKSYKSETELNQCADYLYKQIIENEELADRIPLIKGDFIAQLQDEAQNAINQYLSVDHQEMMKRWNGEKLDFKKYSDYLLRASELIENTHYLFPQIKAKQIYFEVLSERIEYDRNAPDQDVYPELQNRLQEALVYQTRSPFIYNELGLLYSRNKEYDKAIEQFDIAIEQSPKWALPYNNKSHVYNKISEYGKAIELGKKASEINPNFVSPYRNLSIAYYKQKDFGKAIDYDLQYLKIYPDNFTILNNVGYKYFLIKDYTSSEKYLDLSIQANNKHLLAYMNKGLLYMEMENYPESINEFEQVIALDSDNANAYTNIAFCHEELDDYDKAIENYNKAINSNDKHVSRRFLGMAYLHLRDTDKAIKHYNYYIDNINQENGWAYYELACAYALTNNMEAFEKNMNLAIENGFTEKKEMEASVYLTSIQNTEVYLRILDKL